MNRKSTRNSDFDNLIKKINQDIYCFDGFNLNCDEKYTL